MLTVRGGGKAKHGRRWGGGGDRSQRKGDGEALGKRGQELGGQEAYFSPGRGIIGWDSEQAVVACQGSWPEPIMCPAGRCNSRGCSRECYAVQCKGAEGHVGSGAAGR